MQTEIIPVDNPQVIQRAVQVLQAGQLIAFPTDTIYGLAGDVYNSQAIDQIYAAKERDMSKAIAVLVSSLDQMQDVAATLTESAMRLAARYWPGALTLVVPKSESLPENLSVYPTVGVRMPNHAFVLDLLRRAGPLATTSANRSGGPNPITADDVVHQLNGSVQLIIDGGKSPGGVASTVVDCSGPEVRILRRGAISDADIWKVIGQDYSSIS